MSLEVVLVHAEFFGIDHGVVRPAHDVFPVVVALAHRGAQRLFGDDLRQDDVIARIGQPQPLAVEAGRIRRVGIAAAGVIGLHRFVGGGEGHRLERHVVGAEIVGEIELGGGALLHADRRVVQFQRRIHLQRFAHHEALAVVVIDGGEIDAERGCRATWSRWCCATARRSRPVCSAVMRSDAVSGTNLTLVGSLKIAAAMARQKSTSKPVQLPCGSGRPKPAKRAVGAADQLAAVLHRLERRLRGGRLRAENENQSEGECRSTTFHDDMTHDFGLST